MLAHIDTQPMSSDDATHSNDKDANSSQIVSNYYDSDRSGRDKNIIKHIEHIRKLCGTFFDLDLIFGETRTSYATCKSEAFNDNIKCGASNDTGNSIVRLESTIFSEQSVKLCPAT